MGRPIIDFIEYADLIRYKITCSRRTEVTQVTTQEPAIVCPICHGLILQKKHCMTAVKITEDTSVPRDANFGKWKPRDKGVNSNKTIERARREVAEMKAKMKERELVTV